MIARAWSSTARRWPTGSGRLRSQPQTLRVSASSRPWPRRSAATSAPAPRCTPTTPPCRCSPRASARPAPDGSGSCARRAALRLAGAASGVLPLLGRPPWHPRPGAARHLPRVPARRRLHRKNAKRLLRVRRALCPDHAGGRRVAGQGGMLEPCASEILRRPPRHHVADRARDLAAHRRPVRH